MYGLAVIDVMTMSGHLSNIDEIQILIPYSFGTDIENPLHTTKSLFTNDLSKVEQLAKD